MAGFPGLSRAARRAMARAGGFNTDNTLYHGTTADVDELQPGRVGLIYAAENDPGYASMFAGQRPGANVMPMYMRPGNQFDMVGNPEHRQRAIDLFNEKGGWANRAEMEGGYGPDDAQEFWTEMLGDDAPVRDSYLYDPKYDMDWEILDDPETDILYDLGQEFDSFRFKEDDDVIAQATADPSRFRSVNAAFDPAERDSGNLLASAAPFAVGAGMLADTEEAEAGPTGIARKALADAWGRRLYHGTTQNIREFDGSLADSEGDWGRGVYASSAIDDVNANYTNMGPDLTSKVERRVERLLTGDEDLAEYAREMGLNPDEFEDFEDLAEQVAHKEIIGEAGERGMVYPLRVNTEGYANIGGPEETLITAGDEYDNLTDRLYDAVESGSLYDQPREREALWSSLNEHLMNYGDEGITATKLDEIVREALDDTGAWDSSGDPMSGGGFTQEILTKLGYPGVIDSRVPQKFGPQRMSGQSMKGIDMDTQHVITFPGEENRIRSEFAQFDPEKANSRDILAGLAPVGAVGAGMLAAGGSEESQAGSLAEDLLNQNQYDAQLARYMPQPERAAPEATRGGAWELAKMVGKGLAGDSLGGLSAIGGLLTGDSLEEALADLESVRGYFQGDGALSQEGMDTVEAGMNWWDQLPNEVAGTPYLAPKRWGEEFMRMPAVWGDVAYDATGSPVAGALAQMGPDLMMDVLPAAVPLAAARKASRLARRGM